MLRKRLLITISLLVAATALAAGFGRPQNGQSTSPVALSGDEPVVREVTRENNPNYPIRNPFYFEGKIDYELTGIDTPQNAWEFAQRGIYKQDDLEDFDGAIADYRQSISMNSLQNGTCQLVTSQPVPSNLSPAPCMFTVRSRLGYLLLQKGQADEAISLFREVLQIDPLRLDINALIGEAFADKAEDASNPATKQQFLENAVAAFKAELALSPVTALGTQLTGDEANNAEVHWKLAEVYEKLNRNSEAAAELNLYLRATKWHGDTYPWRITLAQHKIEELQGKK